MTVACRSVVRFTLILIVSMNSRNIISYRRTTRATEHGTAVRGPILNALSRLRIRSMHIAHSSSHGPQTAHWHQSARVPITHLITHQPSGSFSILSPTPPRTVSRLRLRSYRLLLAPFPLPLSRRRPPLPSPHAVGVACRPYTLKWPRTSPVLTSASTGFNSTSGVRRRDGRSLGLAFTWPCAAARRCVRRTPRGTLHPGRRTQACGQRVGLGASVEA